MATPEERFWAKVEKSDGCWEWTAAVGSHGYGMVTIARISRLAHRVSYEWAKGGILDGMTVDHLCFNRRCVKPDHLEAVTIRENVQRAARRITHCPSGHEYDHQNTWVSKAGARQCRACHRERERARRATARSRT